MEIFYYGDEPQKWSSQFENSSVVSPAHLAFQYPQKVQSMPIVFGHRQGAIRYDFVPIDRTVNHHC